MNEQDTASGTAADGAVPLKLDASQLKSSYCNVCNATSTREEVILNFGINQSWDRGRKSFDVELQHRIILSPFAAKRFKDVIDKLVADYEARYGSLVSDEHAAGS